MTPAEIPAPPAIADYALLRLIGRGSYGDVWLAQGVTGVHRAVKIVWRARFADAQPYEREFKGLREFARVSLEESRQLALLHVGRGEDFFYYVMELADDAATGREIEPARYVPHTLRETLARRGRLPATEVLALAIDLARALAGLHTRGLVHRDIKPSNVIFVGGVPKLADIGLVATASAELTFVGTEGYVPPEGPGAPSADVFSLGKLLYELATGLDRHDYPRLPADFHTFTDRKALLELNEVLIRACEPLAARRHTDASVLLEELLLLQAGKSVRRLRAAERHLGRALRVAAALAVIAAVAGTGAWIEHRRAAEENAGRRAAEASLAELTRRTFYSATLSRTQRALETRELGLARRLIDSVIPGPGASDLRGFEWHALRHEAQADPATVARVSDGIIRRIVISPDGELVAGQIGTTRTVIWDAATLREISSIAGTHHLGGFSTDRQWLLGTDRTSSLRRWRLADGQIDQISGTGINFPTQPLGTSRILSLTRDANAVATGLRVWDFAMGGDVASFSLSLPADGNWIHGPYPTATPEGNRCAMALYRQTGSGPAWRIQVYHSTSAVPIYDEPALERPTALALSGDGRRLAVAWTDSGQLSLHDLERRETMWRIPAQMRRVDALVFNPAGDRLLVGGDASYVCLVSIGDGSMISEFDGHDIGVRSACWSPRGSDFFSAGTAGDLRRWTATQRRSKSLLHGFWAQALEPQGVCLSPDATRLAATSDRDILTLTDANRGKERLQVEGSFPLGFSADGSTLLALTRTGSLLEHKLVGPPVEPVRTTLAESGTFLSSAALADNRRILLGAAQSGQIWFWALPAGNVIGASKSETVRFVALSSNGELAATAGTSVRLWSPAGARRLGEWSEPRVVTGLAFSPDGQRLALCFRNGEAEIRSATDHRVLHTLRSDSQTLDSISFSPDGTRLFCGGSNGAVHLYRTDDFQHIVTLGHSSSGEHRDIAVNRLTTDAGGRLLVAYRADGTLRLWRRE